MVEWVVDCQDTDHPRQHRGQLAELRLTPAGRTKSHGAGPFQRARSVSVSGVLMSRRPEVQPHGAQSLGGHGRHRQILGLVGGRHRRLRRRARRACTGSPANCPSRGANGRHVPCFIGPGLLLLLGLVVPALLNFRFSFLDRNEDWYGFGNYRDIFTNDDNIKVLSNTLWWGMIVTAVSTFIGIVIARFADRMRGEPIAKALIFLPTAISWSAPASSGTSSTPPRSTACSTRCSVCCPVSRRRSSSSRTPNCSASTARGSPASTRC